MFTIRFATEADISIIQELTDKIWPATYSNILGAEQISYMLRMMYSTGALQQQMAEDDHKFLLMDMDGVPVAFASYSFLNEAKWKLHKLYVLPGLQGKGAGKKMIDFILANIKDKGAEHLLLNVNRYNSARIFYEKLGFTVVEEEDIDIGGGYFMNDYILDRKV